MKKFMSFAVLGIAAATIGACTSTSKEGERDPAGFGNVGASFKGSKSQIQKANYYLRQADGVVINFRKEVGEIDGRNQDVIVIETCEIAAEDNACNPDPNVQPTRISAARFVQRLRMMLSMGPYERVQVPNSLDSVSVADANLGRDPSLLVRSRIELDKVDQLRRTLDRLEKSFALDAATVNQKQIDDLRSELSKIDKISNNNIRVRQAAEKVDLFVKDIVDKIFETGKTHSLVNGKHHERLDWQLLHALIQTPELSMDFVNVPKGSYKMVRLRSPRDLSQRERSRDRDEEDDKLKQGARVSEVVISNDFEIGTTEVTQFDWVRLMGKNPSAAVTEKHCKVEYYDGIALCPYNPVDSVTVAEIKEFIRTLNEKDSRYNYSLPTEAQWEFAATPRDTRDSYTFGNIGKPAKGIAGVLGQFDISDEDRVSANAYAWTADSWIQEGGGRESETVRKLRESGIDYKNTSMPVGIRLKTGSAESIRAGKGMADIHGNVAEWVRTSFGAKTSQAGKEKRKMCSEEANACYVDPCVGCGENDNLSIAKGGSYVTTLENARIGNSPSVIAGPDVGFRLIRNLK